MTVINWERIGKVAGKGFLFFLEYCIKISAFVVTGVVLVTNGSFGAKLGSGFSSISPTLRGLFEKAGELSGIAAMIHDYNVMSINAFKAKHGVDAVNSVFAYLDGGIVYIQTVMSNLSSQPISTFFAALLSFGLLFSISLVLRFARQKGQGSYFNRLERRLSERIYSSSRKMTTPASEAKTNSSSISSTGSTKTKSKTASRSRFGSKFSSGSSAGSTSGVKTGSGLSSQLNGNGNGSSVAASNQSKSPNRRKPQPQKSHSFQKAQKTNKHLENYIKSVQNGG
ncbi:hypothetical protein G3570_03575 [Balneolaceae bacterium YR4-1]|uniref:Uncharacterized protein n=1 Tax=Halalkalibaculum roseum TaxID=2709311 RepID=A0A6M1SU75_9BACT|nr:hypothetical protein [Halalkalibaculum roseum]NGP75696.1 hypothetical protein [Halalkalibaculum roseum]